MSLLIRILSGMSDVREFENKFADYSPSAAAAVSVSQWRKALLTNIDKLLSRLESELKGDGTDWRDHSVYTGTAGIALMYLHLSQTLGPDQSADLLKKGFPFVEEILDRLKSRGISFMCCDVGPIAIAAVYYHKFGKHSKSQDLLTRLQKSKKEALKLDSDTPDEILFGRAGYLYALLFVQKQIGESSVDKTIIKNVVEVIVTSGRELAAQEKHPCPLMYKWHGKHYYGAAHGISGILYMLMQAREYLGSGQLEKLVRPTIDHLMSLQYPSGNYPSSLGSKTDLLVHWCHGAPGFVHMLILAYQLFGDEKYLKAAHRSCDTIWKRGLLKKGYGICHGPPGNAYSFLAVYRTTKDPKYLYRAQKFAEWCFDYGKHGARVADRPLSLFEGLAGTIYFLADLLNPELAAFPAFQLW